MDINLTSGQGASHSNSNGELSTIAFNDIIQLVHNPANVEKNQAQWFMASILKTRTLKDQQSDGQFAVIWGDIDENPPVIEDLCRRLDEILGGSDYLTYTTKSAKSDTQNSRVIVPLIKTLGFEDWHRAQLSFNNALEDSGIRGRKMGIGSPGFGSPEDSRSFLKVSTNRWLAFRAEMPEWKGFPP